MRTLSLGKYRGLQQCSTRRGAMSEYQVDSRQHHDEKNQMADQLRAYCHLDTLAMVEIHRMLSRL